MNADDFIKIWGLSGARGESIDPGTFEIFRGKYGAGGTDDGDQPEINPGIPEDGENGFPGELWQAQQRFIEKYSAYVGRFLDQGENSNYNALLQEYLTVLQTFGTSEKAKSWEGLENQIKSLRNIDSLIELRERDPSPDEIDWIKSVDDYSSKIADWIDSSMTAQTNAELAEIAVTRATTTEARNAALQQLTEARQAEASISTNLPAIIVPEIPALIRGGLALFGGNWSYLAAVLARITLRIGVQYIISWMERKLKLGDGINKEQMDKLTEAVKDLQFNEGVISFGPVRIYVHSRTLDP